MRKSQWGLALAFAVSVCAADSLPLAEADAKARVAALRQQAQNLRQEAAETLTRDEAACWRKFLVSDCLDEAKQRKREKERQAREWEIEAARLERRLMAAERERRLGEKAREADRRLAESLRRAEEMRRHEEAVRARQQERQSEIERGAKGSD